MAPAQAGRRGRRGRPMSEIPAHDAPTGWAGTVEFAPGLDGFAYRPDEVVVGGEPGRDRAQEMFGGTLDSAEPVFPDIDEGLGTGRLYRLRGTIDPIEAMEELRVEGVVAQPNHVMFAHGDGCSPWCASAFATVATSS
jgi:hypothetical protein